MKMSSKPPIMDTTASKTVAQAVTAGIALTLVLAPHSLWWAGLASLAQGVWWFWWHGRQRITAAGLYSLASGVFVGYAAMWWASAQGPQPEGLFLATIVGYALLWAMVAMWPQIEQGQQLQDAAGSGAFGAAVVAAIFSVVGLTVLVRLAQPSAVGTQIALGLLAALVCLLVVWRSEDRASYLRLSIVAVMIAAYSQFVFTGYGRLNIVALGLGPLILASFRAHRRTLKALVIAATGPALVLFSLMRARFLTDQYGSSASTNGPGSVVTPLRDFGNLLHRGIDGSLAFNHGDSFLATAVFWVPRSLWPEKPVGLGSELLRALRPDLANLDNGQTLAALNQGEWWFAFGWSGLAVMVVVIGLVVRLLDRGIVRLGSGAIRSPRHLLGLIALVFLVADLPNLVWVGSFGYVSRVTLRLVALLVPFLLVLIFRKNRSGTAGDQLPATVRARLTSAGESLRFSTRDAKFPAPR